VEFRILGSLEVVHDGRLIALGGPRQRALLVLLLGRANEVVSADRLVDELWGERPPDTAANALQYHVSQLRKALAPVEAVVTREPGYLVRVGNDELDLLRFERLTEAARSVPPAEAVQLLREALTLWRGSPLADLVDEPSAQPLIRRLEELRVAALEQRFEAELELGAGGELVAELEVLVREHPLRERLRASLMRSLYGAGRQAEALDVYRQTRAMLQDELGLDPSPTLQELEQAILRQDPGLARGDARGARRRAILVVAGAEGLDGLLAIAEPLARRPARELILARLLPGGGDLGAATSALAERKEELAARGAEARVAAYTTSEPGPEAVLLATQHDVDLILAAAPPELGATGRLTEPLASLLADAPSDVAVLLGGAEGTISGPVVTPFGGADHDWSAIELAAWLAASLDTSLKLVGTRAAPDKGRRDASRLLARASMMVQQVVGIVTEPVLVAAGPQGLLEAAESAGLLVVGLSDRWRSEGLGSVRLNVAANAGVPTVFVRRGLRPGGLAPNETLTRFTWTLGPPDLAGASG
jgi:DNA-binding SARP family transcriptional activator